MDQVNIEKNIILNSVFREVKEIFVHHLHLVVRLTSNLGQALCQLCNYFLSLIWLYSVVSKILVKFYFCLKLKYDENNWNIYLNFLYKIKIQTVCNALGTFIINIGYKFGIFAFNQITKIRMWVFFPSPVSRKNRKIYTLLWDFKAESMISCHFFLSAHFTRPHCPSFAFPFCQSFSSYQISNHPLPFCVFLTPIVSFSPK